VSTACADDSDTLLRVCNLSVAFRTYEGTLRAVDDVSFEIPKGGIVGIVGETGCGKTVTALSIIGLIPSSGRVEEGQIYFCGRDINKWKQGQLRKLRGRHISMIFQRPMSSLNPVFTIGQQLTSVIALLSHDISVIANMCKTINVMYAGEIVESGNVNDVINESVHPYTIGLIGSVPHFARSQPRLQSMRGDSPDLLKSPAGCKFSSRCCRVTEVCNERRPAEVMVSKSHSVACNQARKANESLRDISRKE